MLKVLSNILCDLDPKVKVIGQKAGICDGVPSTSALVPFNYPQTKTEGQIYCIVCVSVRPFPPSVHTFCLSGTISQYL